MATTKATLLGHRSATSFADLTLSGDLTVNGTTTTLDTAVQNVDKLEIGASSTDYGAKINQASTGNILQLQDGGTDVMVVADGGKVGIGGQPDELLHLKSSTSLKPVLKIENTNADHLNAQINFVKNSASEADDDYLGQIDFEGLNDADPREMIVYGRLQVQAKDVSDGTEDGRVYISAMANGTLDQTFNVVSGKVGIGTTSPSNILHVKGANPCVWIEDTETNGPDAVSELRFAEGTGPDNWVGLGQKDLDLVFYTGNSGNTATGGGTARMKIESQGYINFISEIRGGSHPDTAPWDITTNQQTSVRAPLGNQGGLGLHVATNYSDASFAMSINRTNGTGQAFAFLLNASRAGTISITGSNSTTYATSSDYRLKENVIPLTNAISRLNNLKPSRFNFILEPEKTLDGFLAHEVSDFVPEAITGKKDAVDEKGKIDPQMIDHSKLVPLLVASVQELSAKVTALENATN